MPIEPITEKQVAKLKNGKMINRTVYIKHNPYPFKFKGVENGKPVLFGDYSNGFFGAHGWITAPCEWDEIDRIYNPYSIF